MPDPLPLQAPPTDTGVHAANNEQLKHALVPKDEPAEGEVPRWFDAGGNGEGAYWGTLSSTNFRQSAWTGFTPTLTGSTSNPTLGTGGSASGTYTRQADRLVVARYVILFGSAGVGAGSGNYRISTPVALNGGWGNGYLYDSSANSLWTTFVSPMDANTVQLYYTGTAGAWIVTSAAPFAWAANDQLILNLVYEAVS